MRMERRELDRQISEYEDGSLTRTSARDLAALYIVRDYLYPEAAPEPTALPLSGVSRAGAETGQDTVPDYGDTPFYQVIAGKDAAAAWKVMQQLVETLSAVYEPLYRQVMRQLQDL